MMCSRTGDVQVLRPEHLVGRSRGCDLVLDERLASAVHASLRWVSTRWEVRDLGSRNGSWVDGQRVEGEATLGPGATVAFGHPDARFTLIDAGPPTAFARRLDPPAGFVEGTPELLALPSEADVLATVLRTADGWGVERDDGVTPVADRDVVDAGGRWRVHLPLPSADRTEAALPGADLSELTLRVAVSRHQEHVEIEVVHRAGAARLGGYAANELVLALARARVDDPGPTADRGWVDADALARTVGQTPSCVRQWIYLTRRRFEELGVADGARIVERRGHEVRLGVDRVWIGPL
ncbi:MAG: FHA domain-containing protein [Myxococcota bacterium]